MGQTTLTGGEPGVWRLSDNDPRRYTKTCAYHDRDVRLKAYNNDRSKPGGFTTGGDCTTSCRYILKIEGRVYYFCWKHVPKLLKEDNFEGTAERGGW